MARIRMRDLIKKVKRMAETPHIGLDSILHKRWNADIASYNEFELCQASELVKLVEAYEKLKKRLRETS